MKTDSQTATQAPPAMIAPQAASVSLYSQHGGSDKEYHAYLRPKSIGWTVDFAHGKRGKPLKTGTKTETPVDYDNALKKYVSLVNSKKNGDSHYVEGDAGAAYSSHVAAGAMFGMFTQQPTPITAAHLQRLISDDRYGLQQKANGENRLIRVFGDEVRGGNKKGQQVDIPEEWIRQFRALGSLVANGEHVGDRFLAFDLLEIEGQDLRHLPQHERYARLVQLYDGMASAVPAFGVLHCYYTTEEKRALVKQIEEANLEGVVAKLRSAPYVAGKGLNTLKFQFREIISCIVLKHNVQRSVQGGLLDKDGQIVPCGNITIPPNKPVPEVDAVIDVQHLYWTGQALEQSVYDPDNKSPRVDVDRAECTLDQITRHKPCDQDVDPQAYQQRLQSDQRLAA